MNYVQGNNRLQMTVSILEDQIQAANAVRFIDAFADKLEWSRFRTIYSSEQLFYEGYAAPNDISGYFYFFSATIFSFSQQ
ncbi:MAG: hypothetical protein U0T84_02540 [Chitinophagales bacterium]